MIALQTLSPLHSVVTRHEEQNGLKFKPFDTFYKRIGINKIRFWQIVKGEKLPDSKELVSLSEYFKIPVSDLL